MSQSLSKKFTKVYLEEDNVIHFIYPPRESLEDIEHLGGEIKRVVDNYYLTHAPKDAPVALVDLRQLNLTSMMPFRKQYAELSAYGGGPKKTAVIGKSRLFWVIVSFALAAAGMMGVKQNVKFFTSEKEALKWLKED